MGTDVEMALVRLEWSWPEDSVDGRETALCQGVNRQGVAKATRDGVTVDVIPLFIKSLGNKPHVQGRAVLCAVYQEPA